MTSLETLALSNKENPLLRPKDKVERVTETVDKKSEGLINDAEKGLEERYAELPLNHKGYAKSRLLIGCFYVQIDIPNWQISKCLVGFYFYGLNDLRGLHHHCKRLQGYLDEFCYRFKQVEIPENNVS